MRVETGVKVSTTRVPSLGSWVESGRREAAENQPRLGVGSAQGPGPSQAPALRAARPPPLLLSPATCAWTAGSQQASPEVSDNPHGL